MSVFDIFQSNMEYPIINFDKISVGTKMFLSLKLSVNAFFQQQIPQLHPLACVCERTAEPIWKFVKYRQKCYA